MEETGTYFLSRMRIWVNRTREGMAVEFEMDSNGLNGMSYPAPIGLKKGQREVDLNKIRTFGFKYHKIN